MYLKERNEEMKKSRVFISAGTLCDVDSHNNNINLKNTEENEILAVERDKNPEAFS